MRYVIGNRAKLKLWQIVLLGILPIILIAVLYHYESLHRKEINPHDKILPTYAEMYYGIKGYSTKPDRRTGIPKTQTDIKASLKILFAGIGYALLISTIVGVLAGTFPIFKAIVMPTVNLFSIIPPPATVPLLFVAFTPGYELSVVIIFIFLFFVLTKDIVNQLKSIPPNLKILFFTKGASELEIAKGNFKLILPGILKSLQMNLPMAWVGVYFAETLGVQGGLGFRTFLLKRFMAHDIIIPYIGIVTIIAMILFFSINIIIFYKFKWYNKGY